MTPSNQDYCIIPLSQGQFALVDAIDYERLASHTWYASWNPKLGGFYAVRHYRRETIYMHREVMGLKRGDKVEVDHRNPRETLDNRRSNLRKSSRGGNQHNQSIRKNNSSGFKGVSYAKRDKKFYAKITFRYKQIPLGYYDTAEAAYAAYCSAALIYHGEFARLS